MSIFRNFVCEFLLKIQCTFSRLTPCNFYSLYVFLVIYIYLFIKTICIVQNKINRSCYKFSFLLPFSLSSFATSTGNNLSTHCIYFSLKNCCLSLQCIHWNKPITKYDHQRHSPSTSFSFIDNLYLWSAPRSLNVLLPLEESMGSLEVIIIFRYQKKMYLQFRKTTK